MRFIQGILGFVKGCTLFVVITAVIVGVVGYGVQSFWEARVDQEIKHSGDQVAYSGGKGSLRHWLCLGTNRSRPAVLLEAPLGQGTLWWSEIQKELAKDRIVCAHDRPGVGWSEQNLDSRDGNALASEIRQGLDAHRLNKPVIAIGAGFGANLVMNAASRLPKRFR